MPRHDLAQAAPPGRLREARRLLHEHGELAPDLIDPRVASSWRRSQQAGLPMHGRMPGAPHASAAQLARAMEHQRELVAHARPVMDFLFGQTLDSHCMVILADAHGMLLHALGDPMFVGRAERVALRPGASWHEQYRGTNAIGTALAEGQPLVVRGAEHYLERNGFLTCAAAPIRDPAGRLLGVLDISGDHRSLHPHTLGLVRSAARMIEHRLFDTRHAAGLRLRFHAQPEGIGTVTEGVLALSEDGWVIGATAGALDQLGLAVSDIGAARVEHLFELDIDTLLDWGRRPSHAPRPLRRLAPLRPSADLALWGRLEAGRGSLLAAPRVSASRAAPSDPLAVLDAGDPQMQAACEKARRVLDKPIALLLQGESGVGKEVFARAVHASGPRRDAPFVAVNCAALPEHLIEAELFGYSPGAYTGARREGAPGRIREAHGGTLFLDEIGDMPLALQGRLLRVLQEREVVPLGGGRAIAVDFRLVCATHRRLREEMDAGRFRDDLYYRLNGLTLHLPPLRERQDLPDLLARLLREQLPGREVGMAPDLARALRAYRWPGNLRQLANALQTACALLGDEEPQVDWHHLPDDLAEDLRAQAAARPSDTAAAAADSLRDVSARTVAQTVQACAGNLSEAARRLGISRNTLYRKLRAAVG